MKCLSAVLAILTLLLGIIVQFMDYSLSIQTLQSLISPFSVTQQSIRNIIPHPFTTITTTLPTPPTMSKALCHAKLTPHPSATRGHANHGWLNTHHSFSFASWYNPRFTSFGSLRVLNEDRVAPNSGFPTHHHANFEIFSYVLSGTLTHRDSMVAKGRESEQEGGGDGDGDRFMRVKQGDVQFTTGGTGIAHSEFNEDAKEEVHFLQIWAIPWKKGLPPTYHSQHFSDEEKRKEFVTILSPLKAGVDATAADEKEAVPVVPGTIPIHADFLMGAGIIEPGKTFGWRIGGQVAEGMKRKVFLHLPMTKGGKSRIRIDGRDDEDAVLGEGDGMFVENVAKDDILRVESVGTAEAEVIVLDTC